MSNKVRVKNEQKDPDNLDSWLSSIEPNPADSRDASHVRRIISANEALNAAQQELVNAVAAARDAGDTWDAIGIALGVSRQAAYQRFGKAIAAVSDPDPVGVPRRAFRERTRRAKPSARSNAN